MFNYKFESNYRFGVSAKKYHERFCPIKRALYPQISLNFFFANYCKLFLGTTTYYITLTILSATPNIVIHRRSFFEISRHIPRKLAARDNIGCLPGVKGRKEEFDWFSGSAKMCKTILDVPSRARNSAKIDPRRSLCPLRADHHRCSYLKGTARPFPKINHATAIVRTSYKPRAIERERERVSKGPTKRAA